MAQTTHFNKVSGINGVFCGANGSEVQIGSSAGRLMQEGTAVTSSAAELNLIDGSVAGTAVASKALVLGANKNVDTISIADSGLKLGAGAGTAVTATAAELNLIDGSIAGTAVASKALALGADKNVDTIVVADGGLYLGAGAGTAVTATAAEINLIDGSVAGTAVASKALALGADKNVDVLAVADLKLGAGAGTSVTSTATELNLLAGKTSNYNVGTIQLPLTMAREIVSNDIPNGAAIGGLLASDTTPILARVNGATDKALRLTWAASNVDEIQWQVVSPQDLDDAASVTVYLTVGMAGAADTPTVAVGFFEGIGDTNAGGNTTALSSTPTDKSVVIAAGDIAAANQAWTITVIPGAHGTDAMYLYSAWIEYTRK